IAPVVLADFLACQLQQALVRPTQHRLNVIAPAGGDQYVKLISGPAAQSRPLPGRAFSASAAPAPTRVPWRAGTRASRTAAAASAAAGGILRSSRAGRSRHRKKLLVITLAGSGTGS